jgi:hypothetical protein
LSERARETEKAMDSLDAKDNLLLASTQLKLIVRSVPARCLPAYLFIRSHGLGETPDAGGFVSAGEFTTNAISVELDRTPRATQLILRALERKGLVMRSAQAGRRNVFRVKVIV